MSLAAIYRTIENAFSFAVNLLIGFSVLFIFVVIPLVVIVPITIIYFFYDLTIKSYSVSTNKNGKLQGRR